VLTANHTPRRSGERFAVSFAFVIFIQFTATALVIVLAGTRLARYGDVLGEKSGLGRNWIGLVLLAATTSLPELFTGFAATALAPLPDIAVGDVLGSCMFNLLILSMLDAVQPEPLSARAHQGHALSIGLGLMLLGIAAMGFAGGARAPSLAWVGWYTPALVVLYFVSMRVVFKHQRQLRARETEAVAEELQYEQLSLRQAITRYTLAAVVVIAAAIWLPGLGAEVARATGLGEAFVGSLFIAMTTSLPEVVVSIAAVRIGALDLGIGNVLGSNLFNLWILGLDDLFFRQGPLLAAAHPSHAVSIASIGVMYGLFLVGLSYRAMTKRWVVNWDTGAIAAVYVLAIVLSYGLRS
jgi:cation:H+ antiporter